MKLLSSQTQTINSVTITLLYYHLLFFKTRNTNYTLSKIFQENPFSLSLTSILKHEAFQAQFSKENTIISESTHSDSPTSQNIVIKPKAEYSPSSVDNIESVDSINNANSVANAGI